MRRRASLVALLLVLAAVPGWSAPAAPGKRGRTTPPAHSVSRDNLTRLRARLLAGDGLLSAKPQQADSLRLVVLRIDFPDLAFGASPPADELHDRFYYENQFRYVGQYFTAASCGKLHLGTVVADSVAHAALPAATYGDIAAYDSLMLELATTAVHAADPRTDFAACDGVLLVHAGPGQESDLAGDSPEQIWSGFIDATTFREQLSTPDSTIEGIATNDGVLVKSIIILPEWEVQDLPAAGGTRLGSLGVYAHEVGQSLGMIPLFDASPNFPDSQGLGNFDLLAYGLWVANGFIPPLPSTFNRLLVGWLTPVEVRAAADVVLRDQERGPADSVVARVWISPREYDLISYVVEDPDGPIVEVCAGDSVGPRRFFHFEDLNHNCRFDYEDVDGNGVLSAGDLIDSYAGAEWDFFTTQPQGSAAGAGDGYGLLVLHVDEQVLEEVLARGSTNVEGDAQRKAVDVEEADGIQDLDRSADNQNSFGCAADYWLRGQLFGPSSVPDTRSVNGAPTGWSVRLAALPDSAGWVPGARAVVHVTRGAAGSSQAALVPQAVRDLPGAQGADMVALPLADGRAALVVPADSGRVFLVDAQLNEAPLADADPATLQPWIVVPPEWRGTWIGAPAVAELDGDGAAEVVLCAAVDSAGAPRTRLFAWHRDGTEVRDLDGQPATNIGLLASFAGRPVAMSVFDPWSAGWARLFVACELGDSVRMTSTGIQRAAWTHTVLGGARGRFAGGLAAVVDPCEPMNPCIDHAGVTWAVADSARGTLDVWIADSESMQGVVTTTLPPEPVRLAAGNLDGQGNDEIVVAGADGAVDVVAAGPLEMLVSQRIASLGARNVAPLALADIDDNGTLEILVATDNAMHVLSPTGAEMPGWRYPFRLEPGLQHEPAPGAGAGSPLVADVDGDGSLEIALHAPGGAFLVWNTRGARRRDLEAALPARGIFTPLLADLDGAAGLELAAIGRFAAAQRYEAPAESLVTAPRTQLAVWSVPHAGTVVWGELGGSPGHAFRSRSVRPLQLAGNDAALPSFIVTPNPAAGEVRLRVTLTSAATVRGRIFNLEGQQVAERSVAGPAGTVVEVHFDVASLAPGIYLGQLDLSTGGRRTRPFAIRH